MTNQQSWQRPAFDLAQATQLSQEVAGAITRTRYWCLGGIYAKLECSCGEHLTPTEDQLAQQRWAKAHTSCGRLAAD